MERTRKKIESGRKTKQTCSEERQGRRRRQAGVRSHQWKISIPSRSSGRESFHRDKRRLLLFLIVAFLTPSVRRGAHMDQYEGAVVPSKALPEGWVAFLDDKGAEYYLNVATGKTEWSHPGSSGNGSGAAPAPPTTPPKDTGGGGGEAGVGKDDEADGGGGGGSSGTTTTSTTSRIFSALSSSALPTVEADDSAGTAGARTGSSFFNRLRRRLSSTETSPEHSSKASSTRRPTASAPCLRRWTWRTSRTPTTCRSSSRPR